MNHYSNILNWTLPSPQRAVGFAVVEPDWEGIRARIWWGKETNRDWPVMSFLFHMLKWSGHLHIVRRVHDQDRAFYSGQPMRRPWDWVNWKEGEYSKEMTQSLHYCVGSFFISHRNSTSSLFSRTRLIRTSRSCHLCDQEHFVTTSNNSHLCDQERFYNKMFHHNNDLLSSWCNLRSHVAVRRLQH